MTKAAQEVSAAAGDLEEVEFPGHEDGYSKRWLAEEQEGQMAQGVEWAGAEKSPCLG